MTLLCCKQPLLTSHFSFTLIWLKRMRSRVTVQVSRARPGCVVYVSVSGLIPDPRGEVQGVMGGWGGRDEPSLCWFTLIPIWFCQKDHIALLLHPPFLPCPFFLVFVFLPHYCVCMYAHICVCVCICMARNLTDLLFCDTNMPFVFSSLLIFSALALFQNIVSCLFTT